MLRGQIRKRAQKKFSGAWEQFHTISETEQETQMLQEKWWMNCINPKAVGQNRANFDEISAGASFHAQWWVETLFPSITKYLVPARTNQTLALLTAAEESQPDGDNHNPRHVDEQLLKKELAPYLLSTGIQYIK